MIKIRQIKVNLSMKTEQPFKRLV